jgi:uncharacterized protein (UPF0332 family)
MTFDGEGFVEVAKDLYDYPSSNPHESIREAELRACISRAYYGVFLKVRYYLIHTKNIRHEELSKNNEDHKNVRLRIREIARINNKAQIGKIIHDNLDTLRDYRNDADYKEEFFNLEDNALSALDYAEEILDNLKRL